MSTFHFGTEGFLVLGYECNTALQNGRCNTDTKYEVLSWATARSSDSGNISIAINKPHILLQARIWVFLKQIEKNFFLLTKYID